MGPGDVVSEGRRAQVGVWDGGWRHARPELGGGVEVLGHTLPPMRDTLSVSLRSFPRRFSVNRMVSTLQGRGDNWQGSM